MTNALCIYRVNVLYVINSVLVVLACRKVAKITYPPPNLLGNISSDFNNLQIGVIHRLSWGSYEISECSLILDRSAPLIDIGKSFSKKIRCERLRLSWNVIMKFKFSFYLFLLSMNVLGCLYRYRFGIRRSGTGHYSRIDHNDSFRIVKMR